MASKKTALSIPNGPRMAKGLRALAEMLEGVQLSPLQFGDAEYARNKLIDQLGLEWAHAVPTDRIGKFVGKQGAQLNTFAAVGLASVRKSPIDMTVLIRECFAVIQNHRKVIDWQTSGGDLTATLAELDQLRKERDALSEEIDMLRVEAHRADSDFGDGDESDAQAARLDIARTRKMEASAAIAEVALREKAGELVRASDIEPILTTVADRIRDAGNTIGIQYGPEAQRIVTGAIDETERQLKELRRSLHTSEAE